MFVKARDVAMEEIWLSIGAIIADRAWGRDDMLGTRKGEQLAVLTKMEKKKKNRRVCTEISRGGP